MVRSVVGPEMVGLSSGDGCRDGLVPCGVAGSGTGVRTPVAIVGVSSGREAPHPTQRPWSAGAVLPQRKQAIEAVRNYRPKDRAGTTIGAGLAMRLTRKVLNGIRAQPEHIRVSRVSVFT
jgi:hypothetical protein